jgi:hypothetical protein
MASDVKALRKFALDVLERRFGRLEELRAQGVQPGTRVRFYEDRKSIICAIKVAPGGHSRIHFPYDQGRWKTLSEVDRVLFVRPSIERFGQLEAHMYTADTLVEAFNRNRIAAEEGLFSTNLPAWLSPDHENQPRFIGSGYGAYALWKEFSAGEIAGTKVLAQTGVTNDPSPLEQIERAKTDLARQLGKKADDIQIIVKF